MLFLYENINGGVHRDIEEVNKIVYVVCPELGEVALGAKCYPADYLKSPYNWS